MGRTFDLLVTSSGRGDSFRVYAASETQGQAEGAFVPETFFESLRQLLGCSIDARELDLAMDAVAGASEDFKSGGVEVMGAALYRALFAGPVGTLFNLALGEVMKDEQGALRLRLRLDPPKLTT